MASDLVNLPAETRTLQGKGPNKRLRAAGKVPAVIYGGGEPPMLCAVEMKELRRELQTNPRFYSAMCMLDFGDRKLRVIPRETQVHPVVDEAFPIHVDFVRAKGGSMATMAVPVTFLNEESCPGIKRGGVLNVVRREIELTCPVDAIPETLEADLAELDIGDTLHVSAIALPANVELTVTDRDYTIATITGRGATEAAEEGVEGETPGEEAGEA
ncbi:MAG: 50S ribosomal protein L25/general stress protein Ctc [Alphaproteobacteria bacterium]|jgi:large subunit ribosomal protein L25|nr:50S ribosomal protein L25/general stress protein Ctc [Alphaproteobacteria bacterium]